MFLHTCEGDVVTKLTNEKVPYFNAPIYLQNKTQIGKVDEIFGLINESLPLHLVMTQLDNTTEIGDTEATFPDVEETFAYQVQDNVGARVDSLEEVENVGSNEHRAEIYVGVRNNKVEKGPKRQKKGSNIEGLMEKYIAMRSKQAEDEATELAKEKEASQGNNFSIKNCIIVVNSMELTREEKSKAYNVFKDADNREIFLSAYEGIEKLH
ncbi:hypothetical protein GUJ93_ZPchr0002g24968 [Zizania palustris]|uniref:H/ACA ribonucleoprotein complex subunit n=1 Tax=Zizania palustris TaxID=103762 RepID=A0A8J5S3C0_ZIZPA|nr:hypothetical protein GUJ93_ZPchr0002g24968 [Zizania palustris]